MTLDAAEFIRRFLLHVLPSGFHRIRHYGLFAGTCRARNIERVRQALAASEGAPQRSRAKAGGKAEDFAPARRCPCCGGRMIIVETFEGPSPARSPSPSRIGSTPHDRRPASIPQSRSLSLPAARRTRTAMSSQALAEPLHASTRAQAAHLQGRTRSPSSFRSTQSSPRRFRTDPGAPSATRKSP